MELHMQVAQAVQVLNHDVQSCNRVAANQWLVQFQQSDSAWEAATTILNSDLPYPLEVQLFAAQILKRKIQAEGVSLQADYRSALQAALVISAKKFSCGPPQLLTQICLGLSALVLRAVESKKPVEQLFASLYEFQGEGVGSNAILELLTVLPEEVIEDNTLNLTVDAERRWNFTQEILSHTGSVLEFLLQQSKEVSMVSESYERHKKVLRSMLSWVRVGCFLEIPQENIPSHPLLSFLYESLKVPALFDLAVEVLVELVSRHEALPMVLLSKIHFFREALLRPAISNKDEHVISGLTYLLSEIGQVAPMLIIEASQEAFILTDALLSCLAYPDQDWEIANSTLNFWCTLAEFILGLSNDAQKKAVSTSLGPVYAVLLDTLFHRAEMVADDCKGLPDGLARFRRGLEELLTNICYFLGPAQFVTKVLSGSWVALESTIPWRTVEVRLFILNTVAEVVLEDEQDFDFTPIVSLIMSLHTNQIDTTPTLIPLVYKSAAEVVGSYSKLLCPSATAIPPLLSFLASGLHIPAAASSSAISLRKLCEEVSCISHETRNLEGLLWIGEGVHRMGLLPREEEDIISAIGTILATISSGEILDISLKRVLKPCYEAIEVLLKIEVGSSSRQYCGTDGAILEGAVRALTRLGLILSHLSVPNKLNHSGEDPVLEVLRYFWPLLESVLISPHVKNYGLAVAVCRTLSHIIQASGQHFFALLPKVMVTLCQDFTSVYPNECFIRTASVALEEFGHKEELGSLFISTFRAFTEADTISTMNSSYACDQEPDVVEAYVNFTSTFLRCCPKDVIIAAGPLIEASFKKSTIWCTAMHRGAALAAMSYMFRFLEAGVLSIVESGTHINESSLAATCMKICSDYGESIVSGVLYALLGVSAMTRVHKAASLLQQYAVVCKLSDATTWKPKLGWNALQICLVNAVQALPVEYLKHGEAEQLISSWLQALEVASSDYCNNKLCGLDKHSSAGDMQGDGSRSLKRLVREFADVHRLTGSSFGSM